MSSTLSFSRYSLLAAAVCLTFSVSAEQSSQRYSGVVTDSNGTPLSHARVHIHGRQQYVYADEQGRFSILAPDNAELHISASGYGDTFISLTAEQSPLNIQLSKGGLERIVVSASGIHQSELDMATPVSVLSGEDLKRRTEPTIGETLKFEPGVHANYYGPVASRPIIRGLDGPRVRVMNNGLDSGDVSRVGPDHAISADAITAEQIEVLRGPATLLYGSGAIGGVINVVDNRIPRQLRQDSETRLQALHGNVADETTLALNHEGSTDSIAWHFDGYDRKTNNYDVPAFTNDEGERLTTLENSWVNSTAVNAGISLVRQHGLFGISVGRLETDYGIPGHHEHDEHEEEPLPGTEEGVFAQLKQNRVSVAGEWYAPAKVIETLSLNAAYTDYQHQEVEQGLIGTTFKNTSYESRLSAEHIALDGWHGLVGYHMQLRDYQASGEEAFTPDTDTQSHAVFFLEEKQFGNLSTQLGGRFEHTRFSAGDIELAHETAAISDIDHRFNASSLSAGVVWEFVPGFSWAFAASRSERAPSAAEIYANGAHVATGSYELGLQYVIDGGDILLSDKVLKKETANNLDVTFRSFNGDLSFTYNFFYNKVHNYLYQADTGLTMADLEVGHEDDVPAEDHVDHDNFAVYQYQQADATLYGFEFSARYKLDNAQSVQLFADAVRAKIDAGDYLPRIPPIKAGIEYQYQGLSWQANIGVTRYANQSKVADNESATPGYTLVDANLSYDISLAETDITTFIRATNLTNELAYVHSSFIKEDAPLPGRAITLGIRATF
jgi:iron complex outermembrane recepter protein